MGRPLNITSEINYIVSRHKQDSFATHAKRRQVLESMGEFLRKEFPKLELKGVRLKHIKAYIKDQQDRKVGAATIMNRMANVRWLVEDLLNKRGMIPDNKRLGLEQRDHSYKSRAWSASGSEKVYEKVPEELQVHLKLMETLGLRFKEASLLRVGQIDPATIDELPAVKGTKGGRPRAIPIVSDEQRQALAAAKEFVERKGYKCLIPPEMKWSTWASAAYKTYGQAGVKKWEHGTPHGLRHQYAQERYAQLVAEKMDRFNQQAHYDQPWDTWHAPAKCSPQERENVLQQFEELYTAKTIDEEVRQQLAEELGHGRIDIVEKYIGKFTDGSV